MFLKHPSNGAFALIRKLLMAIRLKPLQLIGLLAVLAPVAYLTGRFATSFSLPDPWTLIASGAVATSLGALLGIPIGLFFGGLRGQPAGPPVTHLHHPDTIKQQDKILAQLQQELSQNQELFEARRGNSAYLTRISYLTGFWTAVKASGQLFVMQEPQLLNTIATAYYWIEQTNRLENLAYEAQFAGASATDNQNASTHLVSEARLLDGPLGISIQAAIDAIKAQLATDTGPTASAAPAANQSTPSHTVSPAPIPQPPTNPPSTQVFTPEPVTPLVQTESIGQSQVPQPAQPTFEPSPPASSNSTRPFEPSPITRSDQR